MPDVGLQHPPNICVHTYLDHHELESVVIVIIIIYCYYYCYLLSSVHAALIM